VDSGYWTFETAQDLEGRESTSQEAVEGGAGRAIRESQEDNDCSLCVPMILTFKRKSSLQNGLRRKNAKEEKGSLGVGASWVTGRRRLAASSTPRFERGIETLAVQIGSESSGVKFWGQSGVKTAHATGVLSTSGAPIAAKGRNSIQ
jgi:hypothetical protein